MAYNTVIQQGNFVSTGTATTIKLASGIDWMEVINWTNTTNPNDSEQYGFRYYWQLGMDNNDGLMDFYDKNLSAGATYTSTNTTVAISEFVGANGFTYVDSSVQNPGNRVAITAVSTANPPVVSTGSTAGLSAGSIVRLTNTTGALQLGGIDFSIDTIVASTSFRLPYMAQLSAAATAGYYRLIAFNPLFYPSTRFISKVTKASQAVVTLTVSIVENSRAWQIGQKIRFNIPAEYGMVELDGVQANIVAVDYVNNTITIDVDSTSFTTFAFPLTAAVPFTPAQAIPFGETADANIANPNLLDDSVINTGYTGMLLAAGNNGPAGAEGDIIYWRAGKSFNNYVNVLGS